MSVEVSIKRQCSVGLYACRGSAGDEILLKRCCESYGGEYVNILMGRFSHSRMYPPIESARPQGNVADCGAFRCGTPSRGGALKAPLGVVSIFKPPNGARIIFWVNYFDVVIKVINAADGKKKGYT